MFEVLCAHSQLRTRQGETLPPVVALILLTSVLFAVYFSTTFPHFWVILLRKVAPKPSAEVLSSCLGAGRL